MIDSLPLYVSLLFVFTTLATVLLYAKADHFSKVTLFFSALWLSVHGMIALSEFYVKSDAMPPRLVFMVAPALLIIAALFTTAKGRRYVDQLDVKWLTWLHVVRVPVEIVLLLLFLQHQVPEIMTFEGKNLDILSGLTAPLVAWLGYHQQKLSKKFLLFWNFICLALLFNIVIIAVLSAPFPMQQFAFDQPNVAVLYFPFVWLPGFIVPIVLLSHLVSIRRLLKAQ